MFCSQCGTRHPNDAKFCMKCGTPFGAGAAGGTARQHRWEYKDITIPLNMNIKYHLNYLAEYQQQAETIITTHLQREGADGWQPEGPTDTASLEGRVKYKNSLFGTKAESISLRLRRLVP
ncbi:MAG: zinc ribbon domain-containing protein [Chloroflexi bacterium]|nr:zinc ribbon domain-containing protein [Chloroflexota bacterium]